MKNILFAGAIALSTLIGAGSAFAENVATPTNTDGWVPANVRTNATVGITGTYAPPGETGSLQFTTNTIVNGQDKADFVHALGGTLGGLTTLGGDVAYDFFVSSSSTTASHLEPALRLDYKNAAGATGSLIWEAVYNGFPIASGGVPKDTWENLDLTQGNFWMHTSTGNFITQYGVTLADWANGASFAGSDVLGAGTQILGVEVGVGSGWGNSFNGAVDHVNVAFANGVGGVSTNFELTAGGGVPEPASWALMLVGFGGLGAALRHRRRMAALAA